VRICKKQFLPANKLSLLEKKCSTFLFLHDFVVIELSYFVTKNGYFRENRTPEMFIFIQFHTVSY